MDIDTLYNILKEMECIFQEEHLTVRKNAGNVTVSDDVNGTYELTPLTGSDEILWCQKDSNGVINRFTTKDRTSLQTSINAIYYEEY